MRINVVCGLLLLGTLIYPGSEGHARAGSAPDVHAPWLELPEVEVKVPADGAAMVKTNESKVKRVILHIPGGSSHINYGTIHTKVNTEAADVVMKSSSGSDGILLTLDLDGAGGFPMLAGRNSVELEYQDQFGRVKYGNFLLNFSSGGLKGGSATRGITALPAERPAERRSGRLFAVVIGVSHFSSNGVQGNDLKYADRDAKAMYDFLRSATGGGVAAADSLLLLNEEATTKSVRRALFTFLAQAQAQDTVLIYLAGHGAPDPHDPRNLYFLTADASLDDMGGTAFPMFEMQEVFARVLKAKRVLTFADTCHGYGFTGQRTGAAETAGNNLVNQYIEHYAGQGQRAVITASDISEPSFEDAKWGEGHGVFTYYLLRGLHGEADRNHDGVVTAGEIFRYLQESVPAATAGLQNPRAMQGLASALSISTVPGAASHAHPGGMR
jgi:hypothetical protein